MRNNNNDGQNQQEEDSSVVSDIGENRIENTSSHEASVASNANELAEDQKLSLEGLRNEENSKESLENRGVSSQGEGISSNEGSTVSQDLEVEQNFSFPEQRQITPDISVSDSSSIASRVDADNKSEQSVSFEILRDGSNDNPIEDLVVDLSDTISSVASYNQSPILSDDQSESSSKGSVEGSSDKTQSVASSESDVHSLINDELGARSTGSRGDIDNQWDIKSKISVDEKNDYITNIHTVEQLKNAGYQTLFHIEYEKNGKKSTSATIPLNTIRGHHRFNFIDFDEESSKESYKEDTTKDIQELFNNDGKLIENWQNNIADDQLLKLKIHGKDKLLSAYQLDEADLENLFQHHQDQISPIRNENLQLNNSGLLSAIYEGDEGYVKLCKDIAKLRDETQPNSRYNSMLAKVSDTTFTNNGEKDDVYYVISAYSDENGHNCVTQSAIDKEKYLELNQKAEENFDKIKKSIIIKDFYDQLMVITSDDEDLKNKINDKFKEVFDFDFTKDLPTYLDVMDERSPISSNKFYNTLRDKLEPDNVNKSFINNHIAAGEKEKTDLEKIYKLSQDIYNRDQALKFAEILNDIKDEDKKEKFKEVYTKATNEEENLNKDKINFARKIAYNLTFYEFAKDLQQEDQLNKKIDSRLKSDKKFEDYNNLNNKIKAPVPSGIGSVTIANRNNNKFAIDVVFNDHEKGSHDVAWIYIPGSKECYLKAQVCNEDNKEITYYENGVEKKGQFNKGDIIISENTVFKKDNNSDKPMSPIKIDKCDRITKENFKKLDLRMISLPASEKDRDQCQINIVTMDNGKINKFEIPENIQEKDSVQEEKSNPDQILNPKNNLDKKSPQEWSKDLENKSQQSEGGGLGDIDGMSNRSSHESDSRRNNLESQFSLASNTPSTSPQPESAKQLDAGLSLSR